MEPEAAVAKFTVAEPEAPVAKFTPETAVAKFTAVEPEGTVSKAAPAEAAPAEAAPAEAASAKVRPTKAVTEATAAAKGRRTQSRAGCGDRRGDQTYRYHAHHDAHSIRSEHPSLSESNPAVPIELQRAALSPGVPASEAEDQRSK
jgi:hypothetical protein